MVIRNGSAPTLLYDDSQFPKRLSVTTLRFPLRELCQYHHDHLAPICAFVMEALVYERSPLADYLEGMD